MISSANYISHIWHEMVDCEIDNMSFYHLNGTLSFVVEGWEEDEMRGQKRGWETLEMVTSRSFFLLSSSSLWHTYQEKTKMRWWEKILSSTMSQSHLIYHLTSHLMIITWRWIFNIFPFEMSWDEKLIL